MPQEFVLDRSASDFPPYGFTPFGDRYVHLRQIAEWCGMDYSHLWRIFTGRRQPSLSCARQLADALEMDLDEFLRTLDLIRRIPA